MADQFCLRWNNFQTNIVSALDSLKCSEDLVDVTLTCEGRNIKAHKVILSACSPYFRNVFKENPCQHPVIILKDVSADDILSLLSYMYQGEVFIEESKLSSFLHTAALLQIKGLTGVTHQNEEFSPTNATNKLYTQLTIYAKSHGNVTHKETKVPALKKRRSSTSDKPNDLNNVDYKKSKILESCDIYNKNNGSQLKVDNPMFGTESVERKADKEFSVVSNGKNQQTEEGPIIVKTEWNEENSSPNPATTSSDNDESLPAYENSMLARSLLSGINPSKSDKCTKNLPGETQNANRKESNSETTFTQKSPLKIDETVVKIEKPSPKPDIDYEPEILLSEQDSKENTYSEQSQALMILAGMSGPLNSGASTSQSGHQSNHAAICGDCPHCGMKYSNQSALKYHVRLMHSDLTNRLCCYLCPRSFTMRETFKEHMWTSHGQRN
ncbi:broad-complex core protein isoforms 1/2/3/4/5 [Pieris rapae]|uniref:broad-complex core protein isoforms 1/2/3/4/5 n=1 Tax=Pieris rapae TaxID=64459 RepID=UPI001E281391|nr:broad-complex core protein isoforms 1/2/3/4/5 [Pieris rapae]